MYKMAITPEFFDAFKKLPSNIQNQVSDFFDKFPKNPRNQGSYNYEKLNGSVQGEILHSARINQNYRIILYEDSKIQTFFVLDIDCHDAVYENASRRTKIKTDLNSITVESNSEILLKFQDLKKRLGLKPLLESVSALDLKNLSVPTKYIPLIKSITSIKNIEELEGIIPSEALVSLVLIAEGESVNDLKSHNNSLKQKILLLINEKVFLPALNCKELDDDIKESVIDTYNRIFIKRNVDEIINFFNDALEARRGKQIMEAFHKCKLLAFEDIRDEVLAIATK